MRGGKIVPIKLHQGESSLLKTLTKPIRLDIYTDQNNAANGHLYMDDGESFDYKNSNESVFITYEYKDNTLTDQIIHPENSFEDDTEINLTTVSIYGIR